MDAYFSDHKTTLFTRDKDDHAELWDGPRTHPEDAAGFFGVDNSLPMSDLPKFLNSCRKSIGNISLWSVLLNQKPPINLFNFIL